MKQYIYIFFKANYVVEHVEANASVHVNALSEKVGLRSPEPVVFAWNVSLSRLATKKYPLRRLFRHHECSPIVVSPKPHPENVITDSDTQGCLRREGATVLVLSRMHSVAAEVDGRGWTFVFAK